MTHYQQAQQAARRRAKIDRASDAIVFLCAFTAIILTTQSWLLALIGAAVITAAGWRMVRGG